VPHRQTTVASGRVARPDSDADGKLVLVDLVPELLDPLQQGLRFTGSLFESHLKL
jgi:hypothetical protein